VTLFFPLEEVQAMFEISVKEANATLRSQEEADALISKVDKKVYRAAIRSMLGAGYEAAGVRVDSTQLLALLRGSTFLRRGGSPPSLPVGEVFFTDNELYVLQPQHSKLLVWSIRYHTAQSHLEEFCEVVKKAAALSLDGRRLRGMNFTWRNGDPRLSLSRFRVAAANRVDQLKSKDPEYSDIQASQSVLLSSADHRAFLLGLAQARGKARSADINAEVGSEIVTPLLNAELIGKEYLVVCRKDSHTICTVRDRSQLENDSVEIHCTICARPFRDEFIQEIFFISNAGTKLLNSSQWMTIWITDILKKAGIGFDKVKWSTAASEDEIDVVVDVHGKKIFLELKDREFGVGDAYPFLYRIQRYGGSLGIVVCTSRIGDEVKTLFREPGRTKIETIEGTNDIQVRLPRLVDDFLRDVVVSLLDSLTEDLGISLGPLAKAWMSKTMWAARMAERAAKVAAQVA
jgi:hypothetical protein